MLLDEKSICSADKIREFLLSRGMTCVGFAPASVFADAPAGHRPSDLVEGAETVVVMGLKLVGGNVNWPELAWDDSRPGRIHAWRVYEQCCFDSLNMKLEETAMELAIAFEVHDWHALYFPGSTDPSSEEERSERMFGKRELTQPVNLNKIESIQNELGGSSTGFDAPFSFRHAAILAGLASMGANNLALHPVFGPRIRFNAVITNCKVDRYDTPLKESVCLYEKGCRKCVETCPYKVFGDEHRVVIDGIERLMLKMRDGCVYSSFACGGTCLAVCPSGSGDKQMKRQVVERYKMNK